MNNPTLWENERLTMDAALSISAEAINRYGPNYPHWQISFSGGKDSTALLVVLFHLWKEQRISKPESLTVLYANTRMELPPLHQTAMEMLEKIGNLDFGFPVYTQVVEPPMQDRFYVRMLGKGYPPPHTGLRYCTDLLKKQPMETAIKANWEQYGGVKLLNMTGYRKGESVVRDQRIAVACSSKDGECGQGAILASAEEKARKAGIERVGFDTADWLFLRTPDSHPVDSLAPILHFRICTIADILAFIGTDLRLPTYKVLDIYGAGSGDSEDLACRTGCVCCPVAGHEDYVLRNIVKNMPEWAYLKPLLQLRQVYLELAKPMNRLRKNGERNKDGSLSSRPNRYGPLIFDARRWGLSEVLRIQQETNTLAQEQERPEIILIDADEQDAIEAMIAARVYPEKWSDADLPGETMVDLVLAETSDGVLVQPLLDAISWNT